MVSGSRKAASKSALLVVRLSELGLQWPSILLTVSGKLSFVDNAGNQSLLFCVQRLRPMEPTMSETTRRDAIRAAAAIAAVGVGLTSVSAQDQAAKEPPPLDAVFRVSVTSKGVIDLQFDTPNTVDQTFESTEYSYAVLDKDGVQVATERAGEALFHIGTAIHTTFLPKGKRSVSDYSDYQFASWLNPSEGLKSGEEYYLIVSVRNLTALAKFKSP